MKLERTKNAGRNILYGGLLKVYQIVVPFLMRTAMIYFMGPQYLGLNSLFVSILQVLNLAELGVGSAMVYSMYKPIVDDDKSTICSLMGLYKRYYRNIGIVILVLGLLIVPFLPSLIRMDTVPTDINVYVLYVLNLVATVISYLLFAYKNSLLDAHQRTDISSKISLISSTVTYILQFMAIYYLHSYYIYTLIILIVGILNNVITLLIVNRLYHQYKPKGELDKEIAKDINGRVKDLFTAKLGGVIVNSVDTLVISAFLGLTVLAIYQNYMYIIKSITGFTYIIFVACTAGIGNSLIVESKQKNFNDLKTFTFIISWIAGVCTCCFLGLLQPFMELWVGETLMLDFSAVICFCVYFYIYEINTLLNTYKDAAGIWHEDRFRPLVTAGANLIMNLILVQCIGVYGVILCTVIATLFIGMPWLLHNMFTVLFEKKMLSSYLKQLSEYVLVVLVSSIIVHLLCNCVTAGEIIAFLIKMSICIIVPNALYLFAFYRKKEFRDSVDLADKMTKNKLHLKKLFKL